MPYGETETDRTPSHSGVPDKSVQRPSSWKSTVQPQLVPRGSETSCPTKLFHISDPQNFEKRQMTVLQYRKLDSSLLHRNRKIEQLRWTRSYKQEITETLLKLGRDPFSKENEITL